MKTCTLVCTRKIKTLANVDLQGFRAVEVAGFEPAASWSRTKRATKLRYTSKKTGANKGTRTPDLLITNQLHYQLCYIGKTSTHYYSIEATVCPVIFAGNFIRRIKICAAEAPYSPSVRRHWQMAISSLPRCSLRKEELMILRKDPSKRTRYTRTTPPSSSKCVAGSTAR